MRIVNSLKSVVATVAILASIIAVLFAQSCSPDKTLFSSDGPLGVLKSAAADMSTGLKGYWIDVNWLGIEGPAALPNTATVVCFALGNDAERYSKFHVPISLVVLGLTLCAFLRQMGFRYSVCALAAIAATLNMNTFSHACWGLPSRAWTLGSTFLAMAALLAGRKRNFAVMTLVAGVAVSNGIMEGFDVGAIFSLYVAAFSVFLVLISRRDEGNVRRIVKALGVTACLGIFAAICAAAGLYTLIGTQVQGISGMQQDAEAKRQRWDGATMWSLPKKETLRVLSPGLFGYRMDTPDGGNYWGSVGQTPGVMESRHSGAGEYAGALVVVLAAFGLANAFRKKSPFNDFERKVVFFFSSAALVSVLFAWGRHAPFYRLVYALPFFSTIRNPIKFMHPFHMAVLILFSFGLEAIFRMYVRETLTSSKGFKATLSEWWKNAPVFDRRWTLGSLAFVGASVVALLVYFSSRPQLLEYLKSAGFPPQPIGEQIVKFSQGEAMTSILCLAVAVLLTIAALSSWFSGKRQILLVSIFGIFLAGDLMRANRPWIIYYDYKARYASNAILDLLQKNAYEHRVTARLAPFTQQTLASNSANVFAALVGQWLQHQWSYYNIQSLEPIQMPRPPEIDSQFFQALMPKSDQDWSALTRMWELSNTRYILAEKQFLMSILPRLDPGANRFRILSSFDFAIKAGVAPDKATIDDVDVIPGDNGRFAVFDFTGALPRANLYPKWINGTNDQALLAGLISKDFDPHSIAYVDDASEAPTNGTAAGFIGDVKITKYAPKQIEMTASNNVPSLLVYNDKFSPTWKIKVDGKPSQLHRANYIMRGIFLPAGNHSIIMKYEPSLTGLYISVLGIAFGLMALVYVIISGEKRQSTSNVNSVQ
jgi:hypothetical protein